MWFALIINLLKPHQNAKPNSYIFFCRSGRMRTCDPLLVRKDPSIYVNITFPIQVLNMPELTCNIKYHLTNMFMLITVCMSVCKIQIPPIRHCLTGGIKITLRRGGDSNLLLLPAVFQLIMPRYKSFSTDMATSI